MKAGMAKSKILIIDDEPQIRAMLRQMLEREGFEVIDASDGRQGIRLYRESPADLVITDIVMPEKEGLETIMELKKDYPDVKIIAISGGRKIGYGEYLGMAELFGAVKTFAKPVQREDLFGAIRELLD